MVNKYPGAVKEAIRTVDSYQCTCQKCGHTWIATDDPPALCTKCRKRRWWKEYKR